MQHEAHPGLPDYGEVSSRERALEQYAQDLHRREIQLMRDRIHKKPVGGGPTLGNAPGRRAAGAERVQAARAAAFEGDADGLLLSGGAASPRARETTFGRTAREVTAPVARPEPPSPAEIRDAELGCAAPPGSFPAGTRPHCQTFNRARKELWRAGIMPPVSKLLGPVLITKTVVCLRSGQGWPLQSYI